MPTPEEKKEYLKAYYQANRERLRAQQKEYNDRPENKERAKAKRAEKRPAARDFDLERQRAYRAANREKLREADRRWREANPELKAASDRAYRLNNKERIRLVKNAWVAANRPLVRAIKAKWSRNNLEYHRLQSQKRRFRTRGGSVSRGIIQLLLRLQKGRCASCATSIRKSHHLDHIQPLARDGEHADHNLQLLCPPCNYRKGAKDPYEWAAQHGRLL